jgi:hypothetical protein
MSATALEALGWAYVRHISERSGHSAETIMDRYYTSTGMDAARDWGKFRKWAGEKVYIVDQLGLDPFGEEAQYA